LKRILLKKSVFSVNSKCDAPPTSSNDSDSLYIAHLARKVANSILFGTNSANFLFLMDDSVGMTPFALKHLEKSSKLEIKKKDQLPFKVVIGSDHQ